MSKELKPGERIVIGQIEQAGLPLTAEAQHHYDISHKKHKIRFFKRGNDIVLEEFVDPYWEEVPIAF